MSTPLTATLMAMETKVVDEKDTTDAPATSIMDMDQLLRLRSACTLKKSNDQAAASPTLQPQSELHSNLKPAPQLNDDSNNNDTYHRDLNHTSSDACIIKVIKRKTLKVTKQKN